MTSLLLPRPLPTLAKALKPASPTAAAPKASLVTKAPVKSAAKQVAPGGTTGFAPPQAPARRLALEAALPQLTLPQGTPSFRVPNGIVPSKAQHLTPSLELAGGSAAKALKLKLAAGTGAIDAASGRRNIDGGAPTEATSDDARVQQSAERVEQAYARGGAEAGAKALEEEAQALGSPELVDQLIQQTQPTIDKITQTLADNIRPENQSSARWEGTEKAVASLAAVANLAGDAGVKAIAEPLASRLTSTLKDLSEQGLPPSLQGLINAFESAGGAATKLSLELGSQLSTLHGASGLAGLFGNLGVQGLNETREAADDAHQARVDADTRLQQELAELDGILTPEQQQQYIEEFHEKNKDIYQAEVDTAAALDKALADSGPDLDRLAVTNPNLADDVVQAYETLGNSPLPARAAEFAARALEDGSELARVYGDKAEDIGKIAEAAVPGTLTQYQAEAGGDANAALDQFEALLGKYGKASKLANVGQSISGAKQYVDALRAAQAGNPSAYEQLITDSQKLKQLSGLGSSIAAATLAFAAINVPNLDGARLAGAVANLGKSGGELAVKVIGTLEKNGLLARGLGSNRAAAFAQGAEFLQNSVLPKLGVVASAIAAVPAFVDLLKDGSTPSEWLNVVSSGLTLASSVLAALPATGPLAPIVAAVGLVVGVIGSLVGDAEKREEFNQEQYEILADVLKDAPEYQDLDPDVVQEAARQLSFSSDDNTAVLKEAGLTPHQLIELEGTVPLSNDRNFLETIVQPLAAAGIQGQDFLDLIQKIDRQDKDALEGLIAQLTIVLGNLDPSAPPEQHERALERIAELYILPAAEG